jgi:hypothetical protein
MFSNWKENFHACFKALQEVTSEKEALEKQIAEANKIIGEYDINIVSGDKLKRLREVLK